MQTRNIDTSMLNSLTCNTTAHSKTARVMRIDITNKENSSLHTKSKAKRLDARRPVLSIVLPQSSAVPSGAPTPKTQLEAFRQDAEELRTAREYMKNPLNVTISTRITRESSQILANETIPKKSLNLTVLNNKHKAESSYEKAHRYTDRDNRDIPVTKISVQSKIKKKFMIENSPIKKLKCNKLHIAAKRLCNDEEHHTKKPMFRPTLISKYSNASERAHSIVKDEILGKSYTQKEVNTFRKSNTYLIKEMLRKSVNTKRNITIKICNTKIKAPTKTTSLTASLLLHNDNRKKYTNCIL